MTRRTVDWVLIAVLMGSWAVLFARGVGEGLRTQRGSLDMSVSAASATDPYPIVKARRAVQPPGLLPGDELTQVEGESLRGFSALGFYDRATRIARERGFVDVTVHRAGATFDVRLFLRPIPEWWVPLLTYAVVLSSAVFLLIRAPGWHLARHYFVATWLLAVARSVFDVVGGPPTTYFEASLNFLCWGFGGVLTVWIAQEFTPSARPVPKLHRALALGVGALFGATYVGWYYVPLRTVVVNDVVLFSAAVSLAAGTTAGLTRAYRRSAPLERRQIRWAALGFSLTFVGTALGAAYLPLTAALGRSPGPGIWLATKLLVGASGLATPAGITIAVVGYRWLDVDRAISATAAFGLAGVTALGVALAASPRLASLTAPALGLEAGAARWLLDMSFVGAAGFVAYRYLRPELDRRMFAERHARMLALERLRDEVGACAGPEEVWRLTSEGVDALLEPESLVVYAREGKSFTPRFSRGVTSASPHDADSLLVRALERRGRPIASDSGELDAFDRAALETLGVALVVPIGTEGVTAFACLGRKRSGDIYTSEERAHLAALAARCGELLRPSQEGESPPSGVFRREGDLWTIASHGKEVRVRDVRGMHHLATLLREPGREFAALDLVRTAGGVTLVEAGPYDPELRVARQLGDAGPVLDAQARNEYRARVTALEAELADAERCADLGRLERLNAEREALLAELESSARPRPASSDSERARIAVTKVIKVALERIAEAHPELGAHLQGAVRRGQVCVYDPDPRDRIEWEI